MAKSKKSNKLKKQVKKRLENIDEKILDSTEAMLTLSIETGQKWTKFIKKAITVTKPMREKQIDVFFDTTEAVRDQLEKGAEVMKDKLGIEEPIGEMIKKELEKNKVTKTINDNVNKLVSIVVPDAVKKRVQQGAVKIKMEIENRNPFAEEQTKKTVKKKRSSVKKAKAKTSTKQKKMVTKKAAKPKTAAAKDNLTKITGIGPKMQQILNGNGIFTYKELKAVPLRELQSIIDNAGRAFAKYKAKDWRIAATKAAKGEL